MKQFNFLPAKALMILFSFLMVACGDDDEEPKTMSATELLTNGSSKVWYLAAQTPEDAVESCRASSPQSLDNTYTFYADGRFELDHGQITEDPDCVEGCCFDPHSIVGTWEFINEEKGLLIEALHKKGDESYLIEHTFFNGDYDVLAENELILSADGLTQEFNPK